MIKLTIFDDLPSGSSANLYINDEARAMRIQKCLVLEGLMVRRDEVKM